MTERKAKLAFYDTVIVGAGPNGLVAATVLARAGLSVLVAEARDKPGGLAATREIEPGFKVSQCAHLLWGLDPEVVRELGLVKRGLDYADRRLTTTILSKRTSPIYLGADLSRLKAVAGLPEEDVDEINALIKRLERAAGALLPKGAGLTSEIAAVSGPGDVARLLSSRLRAPGKADARDLFYLTHARIGDVLDAHIDHPQLKAALAFHGLLGAGAGPRAPGSALTWLHRLGQDGSGLQRGLALPKGGMGAVCDLLAETAREAGVEFLYKARVRRILVKEGRAAGVDIGGGEPVKARSVLSSLDPKTTYLKLVGERQLDIDHVRRLKRRPMRGMTAKVNLSLNGLPAFRGLDAAALVGRLLMVESLDHLELAYRQAKHGEVSDEPAIEAVLPTLHDPGMAPEGKHVLSAIVCAVPYAEESAVNDMLRHRVRQVVLERLGALSPDLPDLVREAEILTPGDLETRFGLAGGHWHHGDLTPDRLFPALRRYGHGGAAEPVAGLAFCGAGSHGGGGVTGVPGLMAARRVIEFSEAA